MITFKLPSGRELILTENLTGEEHDALSTPEMVEILEELADRIENRASILNAKDGLLYLDGQLLDVQSADIMATSFGFGCAEQLVRHLEGKTTT